MNTTEEQIKDIKGYDGRYKISNTGNVYQVKDSKLLKMNKNTMGKKGSEYLCVCVYFKDEDGKSAGSNQAIHRLVAKHFVENPNPELYNEVYHIDRNRFNNNASNLQWLDRPTIHKLSFQETDRIKSYQGENNSYATTSEEQAKQIWELTKQGYRAKDVEILTGLSASVVSKILRGAAWKHLYPDNAKQILANRSKHFFYYQKPEPWNKKNKTTAA